jgi:mono/diheme cytochrome c family protein
MQVDRKWGALSAPLAAATAAAVLVMLGFWTAGAQSAHARALEAVTNAAPVSPATVAAAMAVPAGPVQDTSGRAIFHGKGVCFACHGADGVGTLLGPSLKDTVWLHIDGSVDSIVALVKRGVAAPKQFPQAMPPMGGAQLTEAEVQSVARYVHSLSAGRP